MSIKRTIPWRSVLLAGLCAASGAVAQAAESQGTTPAGTISGSTPSAQTNLLTLNFRGAQLSQVLEYLSDAAGFIINQEEQVTGTVDVWSKDPVSRSEAVELLNSALRKNGYAVVRSGRILNVVRPQDAKTSDLEVVTGNNPEAVAKSEELVTQIVPVRFANAAQLVNNLTPLLPTSATLNANESANSLILVATQRDIRRMLRVVKVLDDALASVSSLKVFPLQHADARQLATVIQQLYAPASSSGNGRNQGAQQFGQPGFGPGGFGGPGFGGFNPGASEGNRAGGQSTTSGSGSAAVTRVVAVADETSNSVIVSAPQETLVTISTLVAQIDKPMSEVAEIRLFKFTNTDVNELAEQLAQLFPNDTRSSTEQARGPVRFGALPFPGGLGDGTPGAFGNTSGSNSERSRQKDQVLAVPDPRTSSLLVRAPTSLMPQIAELARALDAYPGHKETVQIYQLKNARPQQVEQVLRDLFNRTTTMRNSTTSQEQEDAFALRQQQQQNRAVGGGGGQGFGGQNSGSGAGGGFQP